MNKLFAQTIDKVALALLSPKFNGSSAYKNQNLYIAKTPPLPPKRLIRTPKPFLKQSKRKGTIDIFDYAFPSRVETQHVKNNTVYGKFFKQSSGTPKSTVILLHGMHESKHWYQEKHALNLAKNGHDCVIMTLPYHIERAVKGYVSGSQFLSTDLRTIFEALQQAVKDVMALINWLTASGEKKIGLLGIGLGGLVAGLVASVTRKINYLILMAPATTPLQITGYSRLGRVVDERITRTGLSNEDFLRLMEPWDIEKHKPIVSSRRTLLIEATHDAVIPKDSVERLWASWGKPRIQRYHHGHLSMLTSRRVFKDINKFLDETFAQQQSAGLLT
ncbi:MAG: alpha/beta hydrolase family protein [Candidatus Aquicultor sp.]